MQENENLNMVTRDYARELLEIIRSDLPSEEIKEKFDNYHESDIAEIIPELTKAERLKLYKILGNEAVSEIFAHLDDVEEYVEELSSDKVADILEEMDADDAADVLEELDDDKRKEIIGLLDEDTASDINLLNQYSEDVIGSRMTTNFISIDHTLSVKEAMKSVIEQAAENDNITTIYATNTDGTYFGAMSLRDLVIARSSTVLDNVISTAYPCLYDDEEISNCVDKLRDYYEDSIPVLSRENKIMGVITSAELVDVVGDEIEEDYAKLAGLTEQEDLEEPLNKSLKKRLPWLTTLMCLGLLVSSLISGFSEVIKLVPILVGFQSMVFDMSGNTGTQSLAVTIRVIMGDKLTAKDKLKLIFKEFRIGILNGLIIGLITTLICTLYIFFIAGANYNISSFSSSLSVGLCIGASLLIAMICASLTGTLIPLLFKKIKVDPAVASGPLLTTINDMLAATVYYGLAWIFLAGVI